MLKLSAIILIIGGFILTYMTEWISASPEQLTGYEMIEKRVKWGILIGLGIFLVFHQQWVDWKLTLWAMLFALTIGIIMARLFGSLLDGFFAKQMMWLLIELVVAGVFAFLYWIQKSSGAP